VTAACGPLSENVKTICHVAALNFDGLRYDSNAGYDSLQAIFWAVDQVTQTYNCRSVTIPYLGNGIFAGVHNATQATRVFLEALSDCFDQGCFSKVAVTLVAYTNLEKAMVDEVLSVAITDRRPARVPIPQSIQEASPLVDGKHQAQNNEGFLILAQSQSADFLQIAGDFFSAHALVDAGNKDAVITKLMNLSTETIKACLYDATCFNRTIRTVQGTMKNKPVAGEVAP